MEGNFKGFAMLRQMTLTQTDKGLPGWENTLKPQPVYIQVRKAGRLRTCEDVAVPKAPGTTSACVAAYISVAVVQGYGFVPPSQVRPIPVPYNCLDKNLLRSVLPSGGPGAVQHVGSGGAACCPVACRCWML